mgnify:CR=1 FL=1|tara:strand:+ start:6668 stop:7963 length:1296 start_codon:yes stop_codon:yes gene_type:complete
MLYLKKDTASQEVMIGPFVDSTDGVTAETGLSIANTDIRIHKTGTSVFANKNSGGGTHIEDGFYLITMDATDTNTAGPLKMQITMAGALPVWEDVWVHGSNIYNAWMGTIHQTTDVNAWLGAAAPDLPQAITDVAAILVDTATTIPATIATVDSNVDSILTDTGTTLPSTLSTIDGIVDAILVDTGTTIPGTIATVDANVDSILTDTGTTIPGTITALDAVVDTVKVDTAAILVDTNELQADDVPGLIAALDVVVDTVKAETVLILADTNELQSDDVPGLISTLDAVVDTVKAETALIVADTNELQTDNVPGLIASLDAVVDTVKAETVLILADTAEIGTAGAGLSAIPTAAIVTAILAGSVSEPTAGDEAWSGLTVEKLLGAAYVLLKNEQTLNRTTNAGTVRNNADNANLMTFTDDDDGTTFTKGKRGT